MNKRLVLVAVAVLAVVSLTAGLAVGFGLLDEPSSGPSGIPSGSVSTDDAPTSSESSVGGASAPSATVTWPLSDDYRRTAGTQVADGAMMTYFFHEQYYTYTLANAGLLQTAGLDTSRPLQEQQHPEGGTWFDYFWKQTEAAVQEWLALAAAAEEDGVSLTEAEQQAVDYRTALIAADAYGGVTSEDVQRSYALRALAYKYRAQLKADFACTDDELAAAITEGEFDKKAGANDPTRSFRVITLSIAEGSRDADVQRMQDILAIWNSEAPSEERFIALAQSYSEDDTTFADGGLYEDVCKGDLADALDQWGFESFRAPGDLGVFEIGDAYYLIYYVGEGRRQADALAHEQLLEAYLTEQLSDLCDRFPIS